MYDQIIYINECSLRGHDFKHIFTYGLFGIGNKSKLVCIKCGKEN